MYNDSPDCIPAERGDSLAVARVMPQGMQDYVNLVSVPVGLKEVSRPGLSGREEADRPPVGKVPEPP